MADITALGKSDLFFMSAWYVGKLADPAKANNHQVQQKANMCRLQAYFGFET